VLKKLLQCLGLSSLILVMNYGDLLGGGADVRMHVPFGLGGIVAAQLMDILIVGVVMFVPIVLLRKTRYYSWVRVVLAVVVPPYLLYRVQDLMPFVAENGLVPVFASVWAALVLLLILKFPRSYRRVLRTGDAVGLFLAAFALTSVVQLLWVLRWKPGPQKIVATWQTAPQPAREHPLLVWIIFDELSYDQVFEHRAKDLELPNFDALRAVSTLFTDVQPVGDKTVKVIPSLLTGEAVDAIHFDFANRFSVHDIDRRGWHPVNGGGTVFGEARAQGWRTAVVGWYNPYCTIYGDALDSCYFMDVDRIDGFMSQRLGFWKNVYSPLEQMVREVKAPARADKHGCDFDVRQRYKTHVDLEDHALTMLRGDEADFLFLHMAIPHSPNIWSRIDDDFTQSCDSSYLDNLALVDKVLGKYMAVLRASPRWKDTTVIVQGDHSWRVELWNWMPAWTDEDDAASRGVFDPRPALIVHQAGQAGPETNGSAWPLV
jgi:hypothetical protein